MSVEKTLAQRREELVARCNQQRAQFIVQKKAICESMAPGSVVTNLLTFVKQNKLLIAGTALAVAFIKPRRILTGLETGLVAWQAWRNVLPVWRSFRKQT